MKLFLNVSGRIDGKFLVRNSVNGGSDSPYTLTVYYQKRIYNLNIRLLPQGKCVLGKKKINEVVSMCCYAGPSEPGVLGGGTVCQGFIYCKKSETMPISKFKMEKLCQS